MTDTNLSVGERISEPTPNVVLVPVEGGGYYTVVTHQAEDGRLYNEVTGEIECYTPRVPDEAEGA